MRTVCRADVRQVGLVLHPEIDDRNPDLPRRAQEAARGARRRRDAADVDAGSVEHATDGAEVVLHVDHEDGGPLGIDGDGFRSRGDGDHAAIILSP